MGFKMEKRQLFLEKSAFFYENRKKLKNK